MIFTFLKKQLLLYSTLLCTLLSFAACKHTSQEPPQQEIVPFLQKHSPQNPVIHDTKTYHTDSTYKYKFRTGVPNHYQYNYDVFGTDENGIAVTGNISTEGKYGNGRVQDSLGIESLITTEWVGHGKIRAEDATGKVYELRTE